MIHFDKKSLETWKTAGIDTLSVYFYESGCAGTKIQVETTQLPDCQVLQKQDGLSIYMRQEEVDLIDSCRITRTGNKWIFQNATVNTRCGCGTSFSLKSESPIQDKIARMKLIMKQKKEGIHAT